MILFHGFVLGIFVLFTLYVCNTAERNYLLKSEKSEIPISLASHKDLKFYLNSLERIIGFTSKYRHELDLNYLFGIFLVNVNLKLLIKDRFIPEPLNDHLKLLVDENSKSLNSFDHKINEDENILKISKFFNNDSTWIGRLENTYKKCRPIELLQSEFTLYPDWRTYVDYVDDIDKWVPSPQLSDYCLASLAENEDNFSERSLKCKLPNDCYKMLLRGTKFGYALTHRLLFLLLAHFGRGCTVFSAAADEAMRRRFCEMIYAEITYIAHNGYGHVDLMFEQIALCALNGHSDVVRHQWLYHLLQYQTRHGCFGQHRPKLSEGVDWKQIQQLSEVDTFEGSYATNWHQGNPLYGTCNGHVTAVAAASISAAVRMIGELLEFGKV